MTRNKGKLRTVIVLLAAVLCMTAFSTVAYAGGGDYYDSELPPESTATEETEPAVSEPSPAVEPGTPFTEDGIALTRDLLFDKATNKQFITVETRSGHTLYIIIDYDKPADEDGEQYHTYFLNPVDEADLLALLEDEGGNSPITCSCTEKCSAGKVNTACPICSTNMSECRKRSCPCRAGTDRANRRTEEKQCGRYPCGCLNTCVGRRRCCVVLQVPQTESRYQRQHRAE